MHIQLQGVEPTKLAGYRSAIEQLGVQNLTTDSRKDQLARAIERLPVLLDYCIEAGLRTSHGPKIDAIIAERDALMSPDNEERANFSNAMDFFWMLERLAKIAVKDMTKTEITEVYCAHPAAFQVWQYKFTGLPSLLPIQVKDYDLSQHISLGQKHSTHGMRRLSYVTREHLAMILNVDADSSTYDLQEFCEAYHGISHPPILAFMKVELAEEKHQLYSAMEEEFRTTLKHIQHWITNEMPEGLNLLCSLKDETLHERIGMTFEHDEHNEHDERHAVKKHSGEET